MKNNIVIIPGHNEAKYIEVVLKKTKTFCSTIVFVDDGSTDNTAALARKHTSHVLVHETNLGKGAAMLTGAEYAFNTLHADAIVFLDSDDQHDPKHLPEFFKALETNDVVFGVRSMGANMPLVRFLGNKFASVCLNLLYGRYIADIPSGYKGMTKNAFNKTKWRSQGYEVEVEIAVRVVQSKLKYDEILIESIYHDTDKGMTLLDAIHISISLVQWRLGL